ncbi:hypothetical protein GJ744_001283 [Endocarpon pusillum]|uniref:Uncharacterized protein n=1 Tax=Endocarpon pusillum TaxID=364733 RepID=A0A8H7ABQ4_9EURO|nr:hypothetical protein GJ744_001283 [Endocarpon pusillum]
MDISVTENKASSGHEVTEAVRESVYILREPSPCHACALAPSLKVLTDLNEQPRPATIHRDVGITDQNHELYIRQLEEEIQADRLDYRAVQEALAYEKSQHDESKQQVERLHCLLERTDEVFRAIRLQRRATYDDDRSLSEIVGETLDTLNTRGDDNMAIIQDERENLWRQKFSLLADRSIALEEREKAVLERETLLAAQEAWQESLTGNIIALKDLAQTMALHQNFRDLEALRSRARMWAKGN